MSYLRLFRRVKIAPGVTMNLSRSGLSASIGGRGFHQTYGPRGTRTTVGLPGTGVYVTDLNRQQPSRGFTAGALVTAFGVGVLRAMLKTGSRRR